MQSINNYIDNAAEKFLIKNSALPNV